MIKRITFGDCTPTPSPRAVRARVARVLFDYDLEPAAPFTHVLTEWFRDTDEVRSSTTAVVVVEETKRGAEWLEAHGADAKPVLKHMTIATRADGLTAEEFAERWRTHAGTSGGTPIPDPARGSAYVQNHPLLGIDSAYDAINEVFFEDAAALRSRIDWFAANDVANRDRDLFGTTQFLILEEIEVTA